MGLRLEDASQSRFLVRYGETDQMKYMYYGRYCEWLEVGRVDWIKQRGVTYAEMESEDCFLPVVELEIRYISPNQYDDEVILYTWATEVTEKKIVFRYVIENVKNGKFTTEAEVRLMPVSAQGKLMRFPERFFRLLSV